MKGFYLVLVAMMLSVLPISAFELKELGEVLIINDTDQEISHLFFSPADTHHRGPDSLSGRAVFSSRSEKTVRVHFPAECGRFDVLAVDADGTGHQFDSIEVCNSVTTELRLSEGRSGAYGTLNLITLTLINRTGYPLQFLFLVPDGSEYGGASLVDEKSAVFPDVGVNVPVSISGNMEVVFRVFALDTDLDQYTVEIPLSYRRRSARYEITLDHIVW